MARFNTPVNRRRVLQAAGWGAAATVAGPLAFAMASALPIVALATGKISGFRSRTILAFKGIPYGADTRTTRFQAPKPVPAWQGVRTCTDWPARAPQQSPDPPRPDPVAAGINILEGAPQHFHLPPDEGVQSEDCLHLNLWTPSLRPSPKGRPVLVYIHGGAYNNGTVNSVLYDGTRLAERGDVVVVTVNHRLNAFGFLYLAQLPGLSDLYKDSGNAGMLDLVLALHWVKTNIAAFGGDPANVTVFGQSGGGAKCATLMAMPAAQGLFHRVLTMSGQQVWAASAQLGTGRARAALTAAGLGVALKAGQVTPDQLAALTTEQIQTAARTTGNWLPVRDDSVLFRDPFDPAAPPQSAAIPMILGNTRDEIMGATAWQHAGLTWDTLPAELGKAVSQFRGPYTVETIIAAYRGWYPAYTPVDVFVAAVAAFRSWPGQLIEAERRAANPRSAGRTWVYQMDYPSPTADGRAPHTEDIPFLFDNLELAPGMVGGTEREIAAAQPPATQMSGMLIAFARSGDPRFTGLPEWPPYSLKDRPTMLFSKTSRVVNDPRGKEREMVAGAHYRQPGT